MTNEIQVGKGDPSPPEAGAVLRQFEFDAYGALAVDPWGRRWLADVEGCGSFQVEGEAPLDVTADGRPVVEKEGRFFEVLTVVSVVPGACCVSTLTGRGLNSAELERGVSISGRVWEGRGWLVATEALESVDGRPIPKPACGFPVPVFREAVGEGLTVVSPGPPCLPIDRFCIEDLDARKDRDLKVQNMTDLFPLSALDEFGRPHEGWAASHLNTLSWMVDVPPGTAGLRLRKRYDRFHGRQRARVLVDGRAVGWWYEPVQDRVRRWAWADFGFDLEAGEVGKTVRLSIDPPAGVPLWSVSEIEVWAVPA